MLEESSIDVIKQMTKATISVTELICKKEIAQRKIEIILNELQDEYPIGIDQVHIDNDMSISNSGKLNYQCRISYKL